MRWESRKIIKVSYWNQTKSETFSIFNNFQFSIQCNNIVNFNRLGCICRTAKKLFVLKAETTSNKYVLSIFFPCLWRRRVPVIAAHMHLKEGRSSSSSAPSPPDVSWMRHRPGGPSRSIHRWRKLMQSGPQSQWLVVEERETKPRTNRGWCHYGDTTDESGRRTKSFVGGEADIT